MATWKKVIVSGSNAELSHLTASIGISTPAIAVTTISGLTSDVSSSLVSTGSFGRVEADSFNLETGTFSATDDITTAGNIISTGTRKYISESIHIHYLSSVQSIHMNSVVHYLIRQHKWIDSLYNESMWMN